MLPRGKPIARGAGASAQVALRECEIVPTFGYFAPQLLATVTGAGAEPESGPAG